MIFQYIVFGLMFFVPMLTYFVLMGRHLKMLHLSHPATDR